MLKFENVLSEFAVIMLGFSTYQLIFFNYDRQVVPAFDQYFWATFISFATLICLFFLSIYTRESNERDGAGELFINPDNKTRILAKYGSLLGAVFCSLFCIIKSYYMTGFREAYCYTIGFSVAFFSMSYEVEYLPKIDKPISRKI